MSEQWFDVVNGELLLGAAVAEARLQELGRLVVPLPDLLTGEAALPRPSMIKRRPTREWTREAIIQTGQWALGMLEQTTGESVTLERIHMNRLYEMGLAPHWGRQTIFRNMGELRREINSAKGPDRGLFDNWSTHDFASYASRLSKQLSRRPTFHDYSLAAKERGGPGLWVIKQRFGNVGNLNEHAGFPNMRSWDLDDHVTWGVRVMRANEGQTISYGMIEKLSRRRQGPSEYLIAQRFGKWSEYKKLVLERYDEQDRELALEEEAKLATYRAMVESGELPASCETMPGDDLKKFGAQYMLASHLLASRRPDHRSVALAIAAEPPETFITRIRDRSSELTAAHIETEAVILNVHGDIWSQYETEKCLKVA